jgi:hypothetical protein
MTKYLLITALLLILTTTAHAQDQSPALTKSLYVQRTGLAKLVLQGTLTPTNGVAHVALPACAQPHSIIATAANKTIQNLRLEAIATPQNPQPIATQAQLFAANVGKRIAIDIAESTELVDYTGIILPITPNSELLYLQIDSNRTEILPIKNITHTIFIDNNATYTQAPAPLTQTMLALPIATPQNVTITCYIDMKWTLDYTMNFEEENTTLQAIYALKNECIDYKNIKLNLIDDGIIVGMTRSASNSFFSIDNQTLSPQNPCTGIYATQNAKANLYFIANISNDDTYETTKKIHIENPANIAAKININTKNGVYNGYTFAKNTSDIDIETPTNDLIITLQETAPQPIETIAAAPTETTNKRKKSDNNPTEAPKTYRLQGKIIVQNTLDNAATADIYGTWDKYATRIQSLMVNNTPIDDIAKPIAIKLRAGQRTEIEYTAILTE